MSNLRISGIIKESIVDGPGIRFVIFTQGCPHKCLGCHNPQTHDFSSGYEISEEKLLSEIKKNPLLSGITFSGGEPFCQAENLLLIAKESHKLGLDVMAYTGYTFEYLIDNSNTENSWKELLENIDVLVDGPFILEERSLMLKFRGSKNQRVLDVPKSLKLGTAVNKEL